MEQKIIILHESVLQSWLKDIGTFGGLLFLLFANYQWLGDKWYIGFIVALMCLSSIFSRSSKSIHTFTDKESAKKFIDEI